MRILCLLLAAAMPALPSSYMYIEWLDAANGLGSDPLQDHFISGNIAAQPYTSPNLGGTQTETIAGCYVNAVATCHLTGTGSYSGWISLAPGVLKATSSAGGFVVTNDGFPLATAFTNTGGALNFIGLWADTLTITGPTAGAHVQVALNYNLHSLLQVTNQGSAQAVLGVALGSSFVQIANELTFQGPANSGPQSGQLLVNTTVGSTLDLQMSLHISTAATFSPAINGLTSASAITDASNTANFSVQVLTPGAGYTTESGFTYLDTAAVPEPSSILLTAGGLLALLGRRLRQA